MSQSPKRKQKRQQRTMVRVRVPATSANMGPGFDCIGIAVNIWNELKVEVVNNEKAVRFFFSLSFSVVPSCVTLLKSITASILNHVRGRGIRDDAGQGER